ncbi:coagulation factor XI-like [Pleurodeles waltl]
MKSLLLLPAVLAWATISSAEINVHVFIEDVEYYGNDVETTRAPDDGYCQFLCSFHSYCTHFTYRPASFDCFMKHVEQGVEVQEMHKEGLISGHAIPSVEIDDYQCYPNLLHGLEFPDHNVLIVQRESAEECQEACTYYEDCEFFTHNNVSKLCFLKSHTKLAGPPVIAMLHGVISGYTLKDCPPSQACDQECSDLVLNDINFPGHEIDSVMTPDADRCQLVCNDLPLCQFFSFTNEKCTDDSQRFKCSLKAACTGMPSEVVPTPNVQSGFSLRNVRSHKTCSYEFYLDMDFPGNDQKILKAYSHKHCQRLCSRDNLCQMWTYVTNEFAKQELHGNCYLKNVLAVPYPSEIVKTGDHIVSGFSQKHCMEYYYDSESSEEESEEQQYITEETAPQEAIPQESAPQEVVPQESAPQEAVPQESAPQEVVPQESAPQEVVAQEIL